MNTVEDLVVESEIATVEENAQLHGWAFERTGSRWFRVTLRAKNGDVYQVEVECKEYPVRPAAFHWRNPATGVLDQKLDSPSPYNFFFDTGPICAPWNRLASTVDGPHPEWVQANWMQQAETKGTNTLAAMVLRIHHELLSDQYQGRRQ